MHPGSGAADRDNDVYFPPIRQRLLDSGVAVASFDKRGVGASTGRWEDAGIIEQADDLRAVVAALVDEVGLVPLGLFGHSQGGWVVIEAAGQPPAAPVAFVVSNSGPAVSPAQQERYAAHTGMTRAGVAPAQIGEAMARFDTVLGLLRTGAAYDDVHGETRRRRGR